MRQINSSGDLTALELAILLQTSARDRAADVSGGVLDWA